MIPASKAGKQAGEKGPAIDDVDSFIYLLSLVVSVPPLYLFFLPFFSSSSPSSHNFLSTQPITRLLILSDQL